MLKPILEVDQVQFQYREKCILSGTTFSVYEGEIVALIGLSGSGKTTLFRLIMGLLEPEKGAIRVGEGITYMRQNDLLLPWRTVIKNLLLFTELGKERNSKENWPEKALALLKEMGLVGYENAFPHELSCGMRQRVALARVLLQDHPLFLLDEPFASLDVVIREQLYSLLRNIRNSRKKTIVLVTHDFRDALALADRICILSEGKIVKSYCLPEKIRGNPQEYTPLIEEIRQILTESYELQLSG
ncbi:MAG: Glycine betaine transport ATP-binding protein OpuAA [Chlamydiae bacterium]|nr:Glycine betaine transport ATP-binding protein OpuAA [Chlamydiota bacterium]